MLHLRAYKIAVNAALVALSLSHINVALISATFKVDEKATVLGSKTATLNVALQAAICYTPSHTFSERV